MHTDVHLPAWTPMPTAINRGYMWQRTVSPLKPHSRAVIMHLPTISTRTHKDETLFTLSTLACKRHVSFEHPLTSIRHVRAVFRPRCFHKRGRKKRPCAHTLACKLKKLSCKLAQVNKKTKRHAEQHAVQFFSRWPPLSTISCNLAGKR